jgi:hypothetical protein
MQRNVVIAIALPLALMASSLALAADGDNGKGAHSRDVQTVQLRASSFADKDFDVEPPDPSLGDHFVATEDLFRKGHKVGDDHATCTVTRIEPRTGAPETATVQCLVTLMLPEGQITAQGTRVADLDAQEPPRFVLAITGGTGAYNAAHGTLRVVDLNETDSLLTLELIR